MPLTIVIPAKHEEKTIVATLEALESHVHTPHRIIVVNDSDAADQTARTAQRFMHKHPNIELLRNVNGVGTFGNALRLGFSRVPSGAVVPVMADLCDDPKDIDRMYRMLLAGWDIVAASRYMKGGRKVGGPALQSLLSLLVCVTLRALTGVPTRDISNAFKMYKKSVLNNVDIRPDSGAEASMEITLRAFFEGAKITEIPTVWRERAAGMSKFTFFERVPRYLRVYIWAIYRSFT